MFDPTRIDRTLAALRAAWEGQPDLPLGTLFGMLAAEGYGWGVPDAELTARLESMAAVHPPLVPLAPTSSPKASGSSSHPRTG
ncbi:hypothetical protein M5J06_10365 [Corynebacterium sp. B5-R-101]|uniref:Uncharacterized protein n=1 Tax=Corynebacterium intestinale TaxID=2943492 RepID=A0ABT0TBR4_9CORY|nr:hypothetical protein [Corynebacterium intestinale]MCL8494528.1 hypothetical protein [Corynebacterium intestinale]MCP1390764.1 hypothetical protein [Corynebacterium intestinale]